MPDLPHTNVFTNNTNFLYEFVGQLEFTPSWVMDYVQEVKNQGVGVVAQVLRLLPCTH